jgi:hypothetical protein
VFALVRVDAGFAIGRALASGFIDGRYASGLGWDEVVMNYDSGMEGKIKGMCGWDTVRL